MMNINWNVPRPLPPPFSPRHVIGQVSVTGQDTIVWRIGGARFFWPIMTVICSPYVHLAGERWSLKIEPSDPMTTTRLVLMRHDAGLAAKTFHCRVVVTVADGTERVYSLSHQHFGERHEISPCISSGIRAIALHLTEVEAALQVPPVPYSNPSHDIIGQVSHIGQDTIVWDCTALFPRVVPRSKFRSPDIHLAGERWSLEVDNGVLVLKRHNTGPTGPTKRLFNCTVVVKSAFGEEQVYSPNFCTFRRLADETLPTGACISSEVRTITLRLEEVGDASQGPSSTTFKSRKRKAEVFDVESGQVIEEEIDDCRGSEAKGVMLLSKHLNDYLEKNDDCDVRFHVQDKEFPAHSFILKARSPAFCMMLTHDSQEKKSGIIRIEDCAADAFRIFLAYLYTGKAEGLTPKKALDLYRIADQYDFSDLKEECVAFLKRDLSKTMICDVVLLSTTYGDSELLEVATNFFIRNIKEIIGTAEWQNFVANHPAEANKLYTKYANMSVLSGSMGYYSTV